MSTRKVRDAMTTDVATVNMNDPLAVADDVMRLGRVRHMPVVDDDGELVGLVTQRDLFFGGLLRALGYGAFAKQKALENYLVKDAMTSQLITTSPDSDLSAAAQIMLEKKIGCLPVLEAGKLVGILTETDFVKLVLRR